MQEEIRFQSLIGVKQLTSEYVYDCKISNVLQCFLLQPVYLDVMNESYMHNVPKGKLYFHC